MSAVGLLVGVLNICIYVAVLLLVGVVVRWVVGMLGVSLPDMATKLYLIIVALIALVMFVGLLLGIPVMRPLL